MVSSLPVPLWLVSAVLGGAPVALTDEALRICEHWTQRSGLATLLPGALDGALCLAKPTDSSSDDARLQNNRFSQVENPGRELSRERYLDRRKNCSGARVLAGEEAGDQLLVPGCFPGVVALTRVDGAACSGAVIAPDVVLTAAHCLPVQAVSFGVDRQNPYEERPVERTLRHPDRQTDLALLLVETPPEAVPFLWRLPEEAERPGENAADPWAGRLELVSYGATRPEQAEDAGRYRNQATVSTSDEDWACTRAVAAQTGCQPGREFVATGARRGLSADSCAGDSGGPVLEYVGGEHNGDSGLGLWRLVGVTLRSTAGADQVCGDGGVYARVDVAAGWMMAGVERLWRRR